MAAENLPVRGTTPAGFARKDLGELNAEQLPSGPPQKGDDPCRQLESRAGVWRFDAAKEHQRPEDGERWASGIRNAVALAWDPTTHALANSPPYKHQHEARQPLTTVPGA